MHRQDDKRLCRRICFSAGVELQTKDRKDVLHGTMTDISMFGMFVLVDETIPVDSVCTITITIPARNSNLVLNGLEGVVVRQGNGGLGIHFTESMEWYALFNVYSCYGKSKLPTLSRIKKKIFTYDSSS